MEAVLRNNLFLFLLLSSNAFSDRIVESNPLESSPREQLRVSLFTQKDQRKCQKVEMTYKGDINADASLSEFVHKILENLNNKNFEALSKLFHERLKIRPSTVEKSFGEIENALVAPVQFTALELFALNSPDGKSTAIKCEKEKDQDLLINPQFGYPLQFSLWIQASGQKELGRLHLDIVPDRSGSWKIGLWQHFQWTHDQKDFVEFAKMGDVFSKNGRKEIAYLNYDASEKFIRNLGFVEFAAHKEIKSLKDAIMSDEKFADLIRRLLKDDHIKAVVTNYIDGGMALVVRVETKQEVSLKQVRDYCSEKANILKESKEFKGGLAALRCGFILPNESSSKDGVLGSYLSVFK